MKPTHDKVFGNKASTTLIKMLLILIDFNIRVVN